MNKKCEFVRKSDVLEILHRKHYGIGKSHDLYKELNALETKTIDEGFKVGDKVFLIYSDSFTKPEIQKGKIVDKRYLIEFNDGSDEILEHNELYKTRQEAEQALKESKDVKQTRQQESRGGDDEKL
jgi:hypothetical protein